MATVIPTRLHHILPLIQRRLMDVFQWPQERVIISARQEGDTEERPMGAQPYLRMRAMGATPNSGYWEGMERISEVQTRRLKVTLYTPLTVDTVVADDRWTIDPSLGHYANEHKLFAALHGFCPTDSQGNQLTQLPLTPQLTDEALKPRGKELDGWGKSSVNVDIAYVLDLHKSLNNL
jgi:hypothetical protein